MLELKLQYFGHLMGRTDSLEKTLMLGRIEGRRRRRWQRIRWLDDITNVMDMSSGSSGSWWWTGNHGMLQPMRSQKVRHDWAIKLSWRQVCWSFQLWYWVTLFLWSSINFCQMKFMALFLGATCKKCYDFLENLAYYHYIMCFLPPLITFLWRLLCLQLLDLFHFLLISVSIIYFFPIHLLLIYIWQEWAGLEHFTSLDHLGSDISPTN